MDVSGFFGRICGLVHNHMRERAGSADVEVIMFDFEGKVLGRAPTPGLDPPDPTANLAQIVSDLHNANFAADSRFSVTAR